MTIGWRARIFNIFNTAYCMHYIYSYTTKEKKNAEDHEINSSDQMGRPQRVLIVKREERPMPYQSNFIYM